MVLEAYRKTGLIPLRNGFEASVNGFRCGESALRWNGVEHPEERPLGFSAITVVSPEEWEDRRVRGH
jgi:hypothetical protein